MIDIHSRHDNMYKNGISYALICINSLIISCVNCMLSSIRFSHVMIVYVILELRHKIILLIDDHFLIMSYESLATGYLNRHILDTS